MFKSISFVTVNFELKSKVTWSDSTSNMMYAKFTLKHLLTPLSWATLTDLRQIRGMWGYL